MVGKEQGRKGALLWDEHTVKGQQWPKGKAVAQEQQVKCLLPPAFDP